MGTTALRYLANEVRANRDEKLADTFAGISATDKATLIGWAKAEMAILGIEIA
jgi:hypothetical protein